MALKDAGALAVYELAMYHFRYSKVQGTKRAVIVTTSVDTAFYRRTVKMIIEKNAFEVCIVISAAQSNLMNFSSDTSGEDNANYRKMKREIEHWMRANNLSREPTVDIIFLPIFVSRITDKVFVTPPFADLMPPISVDARDDSEMNLDHFVGLFHALFTYLNAKEDVYSIGRFSERIAEKLESLPDAIVRRNNLTGQSERNVSLILVDRTLDFCTPTSSKTECLLARILRILPRLPCHCNDVGINMSLVLPKEGSRVNKVPGCLAGMDEGTMDLLISKKAKEVLAVAHRVLMDMLPNRESPKTKAAYSRISAHGVEKILSKIGDTSHIGSGAYSNKKVQAFLSVVQALTSEDTAQLELLASLEKLAMQSIFVSRESSSILVQLSNIIKTRETRGLEIENLLALLIYVYSLAGTQVQFSAEQEAGLEESISCAIYEDAKMLKNCATLTTLSVYRQTLLLLGANEDGISREVSAKLTSHIMKKLHDIASQRIALQDYKSFLPESSSQDTIRCAGIVERLLLDLLDPARREPKDLQGRSTSIISAGFNLLLKGRAKRHPCDNGWIIVYVLGGITPEEIRITEEIALSSESGCRLTLAGSRLLNPLDIVDKILLSSYNESS
ncbi:hypothetical protein KM043_001562 [Ampulex compressa]|nr:hypothetical protein KM043_001562 [Ampulex compressa]